jgi:hypothetical protein
VSRSAAFFASLLVCLGRPTWWLLALAGFLARGGMVLAILPIVMLPSPLALSNLVAPVIVPLALGRVDETVVVAVALIAVGLLAWILVGGLVGAATDLALIRDGVAAAGDEGVAGRSDDDAQAGPARPGGGATVIVRILAVRLLAHLPFGIAIAIGAVGMVATAYAVLTLPGDLATPVVVRVVVAAAGPIIGIIVTWFLGELVGGVAARRIVLDGTGIQTALGGAVVALVRRPRSTLLPVVVTTIPLVVIVAGTLGGARIAWLRADAALTDPTIDGGTVVVTLMTFVAIWLAALTLIGLLTATRSAALTFEAVRDGAQRLRSAALRGDPGDVLGGTFGASTHHRPGDRPIGDDGVSL